MFEPRRAAITASAVVVASVIAWGVRIADRGIDIAVRQHCFHRFPEPLGGGVPEDVHRVGVRPGCRQHLVERFHRRRLELGQHAAAGEQGVSCHYPRTARVRDDRQARAQDRVFSREQLDRREHLFDPVDADQAPTAERGVVDIVLAHHGAGMGDRSLCRRRETSCLVDDDRFGAGKRASR